MALWVNNQHWFSHPVARVWEEAVLLKVIHAASSTMFVNFFLIPSWRQSTPIKVPESPAEFLLNTHLLKHLLLQRLLENTYRFCLGTGKLNDWHIYTASLPTRDFVEELNFFNLFPLPTMRITPFFQLWPPGSTTTSIPSSALLMLMDRLPSVHTSTVSAAAKILLS